jgi:hypothetical protein
MPERVAPSTVALTERLYYSRNHAQAAARFAREAGALERQLISQLHLTERSWSRPERDQLWSYVTSCVMSAVAALEAAINELYDDASDLAGHRQNHEALLYAGLDQGVASNLAYAWEIAERQLNPLQRYQLALTIAGLPRVDPGHRPFQDCALIIKLRNYLTHSRPEWLGPTTKLGEQLTGRFSESPLSQEGNPFVPYKALSYDCAVWAVNSSVKLIDNFFSTMHLPSPLDSVREALETRLPEQRP